MTNNTSKERGTPGSGWEPATTSGSIVDGAKKLSQPETQSTPLAAFQAELARIKQTFGHGQAPALQDVLLLEKLTNQAIVTKRYDLAQVRIDRGDSDQLNAYDIVPITNDGTSLVLMNPASLPKTDSFRGGSAEPYRNSHTGDLGWFPAEGNHFSAVTPVVEERPEIVVKTLSSISYSELVDFLASRLPQLNETDQADTRLEMLFTLFLKNNGAQPSSTRPQIRTPVVRGSQPSSLDLDQAVGISTETQRKLLLQLESMFIGAGLEAQAIAEIIAELKSDRLTSATISTTRVGVSVIESSSEGKQVDSFTVFIDSEKKTVNDRENVPSTQWYADVRCGSGGTGRYNFGLETNRQQSLMRKPLLYLYAENEPIQVSVRLQLDGNVVFEHPKSDAGEWNMTVHADGTLVDRRGKKYPSIFWEGRPREAFAQKIDSGYSVPGDEVVSFFEAKLTAMGLSERETAEFISYWGPIMSLNPFNIVSFVFDEYQMKAPLTIVPTPDSLIRVFMVFKASTSRVELAPQELPSITRRGFTVVEWGGANLDE